MKNYGLEVELNAKNKNYDMPQIRRNTLSEEEILQNKLKHYYQLQEELKEYLNS